MGKGRKMGDTALIMNNGNRSKKMNEYIAIFVKNDKQICLCVFADDIFDAMIIAEKIAKKRHGNEIQLVQILLKSRLGI